MLRRRGQGRSLEWFGQGRFTFLAPKDGHRDDAPIARDGFDKSQNVLISLPSVLFGPHRRVNAPNQATLLPCKTRYLVIAGRLLQVTRRVARAERNNRLRSSPFVGSSYSCGTSALNRTMLHVMDVSATELKRAVEAQHGCKATVFQSVPIKEAFGSNTVWEGVVHIFSLTGHPTAKRAYAWSSPIVGSDKRRLFAVLHQSPVTSPVEAVRAAIEAENREKSHHP